MRGRRAALAMLPALVAILCEPGWVLGQTQQEIESALELYRFRLLQATSHIRSYPQEAIDQGLEGNAAIELVIAGNGSLKSLKLVKSTGQKLLDEHAINLIQRAVPLTQIPSTLQNKAFAVRFAMAFRIPE